MPGAALFPENRLQRVSGLVARSSPPAPGWAEQPPPVLLPPSPAAPSIPRGRDLHPFPAPGVPIRRRGRMLGTGCPALPGVQTRGGHP